MIIPKIGSPDWYNQKFEMQHHIPNIYGDGIGQVSTWNAWIANRTHDKRAEVVSTISTLSYGNEEAKNPRNLFKRLVKLGHLSTLEFVQMADDENFIYGSLRHHPYELTLDDHLEDVALKCESYVYENTAVMKIKCPIFIARQFMRHRQFSYLELSRRYVPARKVKFEFFNPENDARKAFYHEMCVAEYLRRLEEGEKPEDARGAIPQEAYTEFFVGMDVNGFANFCNLRFDAHAQGWIRILTEQMMNSLQIVQPEFVRNVKDAMVELKENSESLYNKVVPKEWQE